MPEHPEGSARKPSARLQGSRPGGPERRRQILREALHCFATSGFRGTTTREVARRVGITEAALYRYFENKEALYSAIIHEKIQAPDPLEGVAAAAAAGEDRAVFEGLARVIVETIEADPSFLRILLYTALEGHALAAPFFETRIQRLRRFLAGYIERRSREGAFRELDPMLAARAFLGMVIDHLIVREIFGQRQIYPQSSQVVTDTFVSIFLCGVRRPPEAVR
ncbi:MAG: TetR/AcrR family transcriptional regulator [Myxococcota bacterium]